MSRSVATLLHPLVSPKVSSTAAMLSSKCAQLLTADQHLTLLRLVPGLAAGYHSMTTAEV